MPDLADETIHDWLKAKLEPLIPTDWRITPGLSIPGTIDRIYLAIKNLKITPLPEAPYSHLNNATVVTVVGKHTDQSKATLELDDQVLALVMDLQSIDGVTFVEANKVLVNDTYIGWDISLLIISKKKEPTDG